MFCIMMLNLCKLLPELLFLMWTLIRVVEIELIFLDYKICDQISRNVLYHCFKLCKNLIATQKATKYPSAECRSIKSKWKTLAFAKKTFRKLWGPKHTPNKPTFNLSALIKKLCPTFPRKEVNLALEIYSRNLACPLPLQ